MDIRMKKIKQPPEYNPTTDLLRAMTLLEKIRAMKIVNHHKDLKAGINKLEQLFASTLVDCVGLDPDDLTPIEKDFARQNAQIPAIKLIRARRPDLGLADAKELIIKWQKENGIDPFGAQT